MQINVRHIKLSTGMARGRQSSKRNDFYASSETKVCRRQSFFSYLFVLFLQLCCSLSLPDSLHEHRNFWHGASVTGMKKRVPWSRMVPFVSWCICPPETKNIAVEINAVVMQLFSQPSISFQSSESPETFYFKIICN